MKSLKIDLGYHQYPIYIDRGLLMKLPELLTKQDILTDRKLLVISDSKVAPRYANELIQSLQQAGYHVDLAVVPAGEKSKSIQQLEWLVGRCIEHGLDRRSVIMALGGGVVGDLAGFVAASYMRGISFIQIPTTLLAHDSSVGGKVGINHPLAKNYMGAFHQPLMVVFDVDTLQTLPSREVSSGFAEVVKHGLIWDATFVQWLEANADALLALNGDSLIEAIYRGCQVKAAVVTEDEKEQGLRAILNYGHTIGHALEAVSKFEVYTHGEAIAIGMAGAVRLSQIQYGLDATIVTRTEALLQRFGLPVKYRFNCNEKELLIAMQQDKKVQNGKYTFVLSSAIGKVELVREINEMHIKKVLEQIQG